MRLNGNNVTTAMRVALAFLLFAAAIPLAWLSWGPLHNLFEDYQDSHPVVYLAYGLPLVVLALACIIGGLVILRRER